MCQILSDENAHNLHCLSPFASTINSFRFFVYSLIVICLLTPFSIWITSYS